MLNSLCEKGETERDNEYPGVRLLFIHPIHLQANHDTQYPFIYRLIFTI